MSATTILLIIYAGVLVIVCVQIVLSTSDTSKALAYLLFAVFIPILGMAFYLIFGENYLNKKRYGGKLSENRKILKQIKEELVHFDAPESILEEESLQPFNQVAAMLTRISGSPLTKGNNVKLLKNGENKFPELAEAIRSARHHVHLEYFIFRCDNKIGSQLIELLIEKAEQGVEVRLIYDDFGSPSISKELVKRMQEVGVSFYPFYEIKFYLLANRYNYRNHRKVVIIDGQTAFVGGINVADEYINDGKSDKYWRDTHLRLDGPAVYYLQYLFIADWQFCCGQSIENVENYYKKISTDESRCMVQIAASGPDAIQPTILYSLLQIIYSAKEEILITTPYFIPEKSLSSALCTAAQVGLSVKILVPKTTDSVIADAAANSYYAQLLEAGVEIYQYRKGFLHAKTIVADQSLAMIGTANIDNRSFNLNFEVNAVIYDQEVAKEMHQIFRSDLQESDKIDKKVWLNRPWYQKFPEKLASLTSPVL